MVAVAKDDIAPEGPALSLRRVVSLLRPLFSRRDKLRFGLLFTLMLGGAMIEMAALAVLQLFMGMIASGHAPSLPILGRLGEGADTATILIWGAAALGGVYLLRLAYFSGLYAFLAWVVTRQRVALSARLFSAYQQAPYLWLMRRTSSEIQRNITGDVDAAINRVVVSALELMLGVTIAVGVSLFLVVTLPPVVLIGVAIAGLVLTAVTGLSHGVLARAGQIKRAEGREALKAIQQGVGALTEARILGRTDWFHRQFRSALQRAARATRQTIFTQRIVPLVIDTLVMLALIAIIVGIILQAQSLDAALPLAAVLAAAAVRLKQAMSRIATARNRISNAGPALTGLVAELGALDVLAPTPQRRRASAPVTPFETLRFEGASFRFPARSAVALDRVDFTIRRGEKVALVGRTGSGKSTLIHLLLGLIPPSEGRVLVNGQDIAADLPGWRARLGYVPQAIYLTEDSIAANVALGEDPRRVDRARVLAALEQAQLAGHVATLPQGIDTNVGEHGARLSGGQRQRIGIARALYRAPQVLVLDEATSALDRETEAHVMAAIARLPGPPTVLTVTHRLESIRACDRLLFLDGGRLVAEGSYDSLLAEVPGFRDMALAGTGEADRPSATGA